MPEATQVLLWEAIADALKIILLAAVAVIVAFLHRIQRELDDQRRAMKARDIRSDEIQENVRRLVNGRGVHYELRRVARPTFDGTPPEVEEAERRGHPREPPGDVTHRPDPDPADLKYLDLH